MEYEINQQLSLVKIRCGKDISAPELHDVLRDIFTHPEYDHTLNCITDCRDLKKTYSPNELRNILKVINEHRAVAKKISKCAVVVNDEVAFAAATAFSIFAMASKNSTIDVRVFGNVTNAEKWIGLSAETPA